MQMIKGGGAALTREKIIASVAEKFLSVLRMPLNRWIFLLNSLPVEVTDGAQRGRSSTGEAGRASGVPSERHG
ncbi:ribose-5-phosphate isomerase A [Salmonella enterica subsp. enterica]|nr:ribose-5-phosphate isomerase A [Salmonella enterica subsp. enterica]